MCDCNSVEGQLSGGSIDLFDCVGIDKTGGRKGFGFDITVCLCAVLDPTI